MAPCDSAMHLHSTSQELPASKLLDPLRQTFWVFSTHLCSTFSTYDFLSLPVITPPRHNTLGLGLSVLCLESLNSIKLWKNFLYCFFFFILSVRDAGKPSSLLGCASSFAHCPERQTTWRRQLSEEGCCDSDLPLGDRSGCCPWWWGCDVACSPVCRSGDRGNLGWLL